MSIFSRYRDSLIGLRSAATKMFWPGIALCLGLTTIYNLQGRAAIAADAQAQQAVQSKDWRSYADNQAIQASVVGRTVRWPPLQGYEAVRAGKEKHRYRVIAVLNGIQCSAPRNEVTELLRLIQSTNRASGLDGPPIVAVIAADDVRTVETYRITNKFHFPVLLDISSEFRAANGLLSDPALLVVDEQDTVLSVFSPGGKGAVLWPGYSTSLLNLLKRS